MQTRPLGNSGLHLTTVGLGTWAQGGSGWAFGWGAQEDTDSIAAIHRALDLGVNWIDTAAVYGLGHAEEVLGQALRGRRDGVIVATKSERVWDEHGNISGRLKRESILKECEDSLRRLQVDVIDLYQIHWPQPDEDIEEGWSAMAELVQQGKVRHVGVSNFSVPQMRRAQAIHPIASLQPPYSMLRRGIEAEALSYCAEHGIGVIVYSPMQVGLLTGKFSRERVQSLPDDDFRKRERVFTEPELSVNLAFVERLRPIAERNGRSLGQLAIAWVLRRPEVTAAIVGARRASQIEETAPGGDWVLSDADAAEVERLLAEREERLAEHVAAA